MELLWKRIAVTHRNDNRSVSRFGTVEQRKGDNMTSLDVVKMVRLNPSVALQLISEK